MSAMRTGRPGSMRASRSTTRTAVNGPPASAAGGGRRAGSGNPRGRGALEATAVAPGPSQVPGSPTAGRRRGTVIRRAAMALALVLTFSVGIGVGWLAPLVSGGAATTTPNPTGTPAAAAEHALIDQ